MDRNVNDDAHRVWLAKHVDFMVERDDLEDQRHGGGSGLALVARCMAY
jgi:hypothetical protein